MITTDNNQTLLEQLRAESEKLYPLRHEREGDLINAYMADAASKSEEIARLKEIESEWMRLSQEDGKAERAIDRLEQERDKLRAELEKITYVCEVSSHWNGASGFDVRNFKALPPVGTKLYLVPPVTQPFTLPIPKEQP